MNEGWGDLEDVEAGPAARDPTNYALWTLIGLGLIGLSCLLEVLVPRSGDRVREKIVWAWSGIGMMIWIELLRRAWRNRG